MRGVGFSRRGTFLRKSGPPHDPDRLHLHVICTDEDRFGMILVVPLCSLHPDTSDRACLLDIGDHPYIDRKSYIHYRKTEILDVAALQESLRRGDITPHQDCREEILKVVCDGLMASKATRPNKKDYLKASRDPLSKAA